MRGLLDGGVVVRCFGQDGSRYKDFDFSRLPVAPSMQQDLAVAFDRRTAPGGRFTSLLSVETLFVYIRSFAEYLAGLAESPAGVADLNSDHLDGFSAKLTARRASAPLGAIKALLSQVDGLDDAVVAKLRERNPSRVYLGAKTGYSRGEFQQIVSAARHDLRAAADRIRGNRAELAQYRAGEVTDSDRRLEILDFVDRHADVPRYRFTLASGEHRAQIQDWVRRFGSPSDHVGRLHLLGSEVLAAAVLLAALTGQNPGVILGVRAAHHRTDGHTGQTATAILDTHKPRRGRRAYMNLALSEVPDWISIPENRGGLSARDELHTSFGVYCLLVELTARSREVTGTDKLLVGYCTTGGGGGRLRGIRLIRPHVWYGSWSASHGLVCDAPGEDGNFPPLRVRMDRIRLTYLELHQKPVAHREETLVADYLTRNRSNVGEYRKIVAGALATEVDKARTRGIIDHLSAGDLARAREDPETVATEHGVDAVTLERMLAGELDTVIAACVDDGTGPHSGPGRSCRASFMQCLGCPCARAMPRHLPVQVLVHDRLEAREAEMAPLTWVARFGMPHAQLTDLLDRHDAADVDDARTAATDTDRALVERFLTRELDLR